MSSPEPVNIQDAIRQLQAGGQVPIELMEIFNEEADDHMRIIYDGLNRLHEDSDNLDAMAEVRRSAHTLKGASGAVGLESVTRLSHRMEDLLDQLAGKNRCPDSDQLRLLLTTADLLQDLTSGEIDVDATAIQMVEIYECFTNQLESTDSQPKDETTANGVRESTATRDEKQSVECLDAQHDGEERRDRQRTTEESRRFLRVPLQRLDDLVGTVGEMIVNRSAMNLRLTELESRIEEIINTIHRTRSNSFDMQNNYNIESASNNQGWSQAGNCPASASRNFDTLEFDQYTDFHLLAQVLAEGNSDVEIVASELHSLRNDLDNLLRRQDQLNRDAQNSLMHIRMVPLSSIVSKLQRTVRTVSGKLEKSVELVVTGDRTELDKTVLDVIVDPLQHLIRNAMDHGVETHDERIKAGKPEQARIVLEAIYQGTQVTIRISDDGRGINIDRVRQKAIQNGLIGENDDLTREELYSLIFLPGFSTAIELTDVSGRGVGMDVVRAAIVRLNGTIRVNSEPGMGTTFTIQLPTTVGVTQALLVETVGQSYAIPMQSIRKIMRLDLESVGQRGERLMVQVDDQWLALRDLANHLNLPRAATHRGPNTAPSMLILQVGDDEVAVLVDSIIGGQDIVVKNLGDHLRHVPGLIGAMVSGDGSIIPILDPVDLASHGATVSPAPFKDQTMSSNAAVVRVSTAMVIDDSISVRRVTSNLLQKAGWDVVTACDGIDALEQLDEMETLPDIFLCDMEMPRMDGIELIKRLRKQSEFAATPIVLVTSRGSEKHRSMAFDAGTSEYVVKPYNDEHLLELIDELVQSAWETVGG